MKPTGQASQRTSEGEGTRARTYWLASSGGSLTPFRTVRSFVWKPLGDKVFEDFPAREHGGLPSDGVTGPDPFFRASAPGPRRPSLSAGPHFAYLSLIPSVDHIFVDNYIHLHAVLTVHSAVHVYSVPSFIVYTLLCMITCANYRISRRLWPTVQSYSPT